MLKLTHSLQGEVPPRGTDLGSDTERFVISNRVYTAGQRGVYAGGLFTAQILSTDHYGFLGEKSIRESNN